MSEVCVRITEFTDPACPWAYSAEPFRHRIDWLYEGRIEWEPRMVVLASTREEQEEKGLTPEVLADGAQRIAADHKMPIDTRVKPYVPPSAKACKLVVAARVRADSRAVRKSLRSLRIQNFRGAMLDDPETIRTAAAYAGIESDYEAWMSDPKVERELERDLDASRKPMPAANVLDHKLANWSGGRRYTCPSYEITRLDDSVTISVPGFQPFAVYDTILANLVPGLDRRDAPGSVEEVMRWRSFPMSTQEVAIVCDIPFDTAREELGRIAELDYIGADGFWTLTV